MRSEVAARIFAQAAEFMVKHEDFTVAQCIHMAIITEAVLYGCDDERKPQSIVGRSPIETPLGLIRRMP